MTISLTGFMGCGKSSTGRILARRLGACFIDLDDEIVRRSGRTIPDIFREDGEAAFRTLELETLQAVLDTAAAGGATVIALGGGTLTTPGAREAVFQLSECVYLRTRLDTIRGRLGAADSSRPLFRDAERLFAAREDLYAQAPFVVDTDGKTPDEVAEEVLDLPLSS